MRVSATILGFLAAASLTLSPAFAGPANKPSKQGKPTSAGKPTTVGKTAGGGKPTSAGKTAAAGKPTTTGKPVASTTTSRTTGKPATSGKPTKSDTGKPTVMASGGTTSGSKSKSKTTATTTTQATPTSNPAGTGTTTGSTTPMNPIAEKIASKPNLSAKLTNMLPIDPLTGKTMTLDKASLGFKNQGQFIAALHVSQNLGIPFTELKSHMVTVTPGAPGEPPTATQTGSLGRAIQASKTSADATTEVRRAEAQANVDLQTTTSTTTGSRSTRTKTKKPTDGGAR
jgi:hypothetical protein